ncbi:deoxynucleoside triphosphate triphosphohydrolase SAMHD1 homolog isoform X2 [Drosophila hydei]|nr:deoxynucleoside triphosphate triphosphohydrolase SAMHD1 homolog isoform X2 [Drosophila hydei]
MLIEDEVHGVIEIPSHIEEILNHEIFQRLKRVKQTGLLSLAVNPASTQTRYEHCIGTYKSAQDLLTALKRNSNYERELPEWCRQSVEIAALLHDVGHGPFSHYWEQVCGKSFDHEQNGLVCVDKIFADMKSEILRSLRDDNNGRGVQLIKALILDKSELLTYPMMGHGYLFDIIHNSRSGLDVDKWDYLRRDNKRLKLLSDEDMQFDDVFLKARIAPDGQRIEYRYDDFHLIYKLYMARWRLHIGAYQQPKALAFDYILCKIVRRCKPHLLDVRADSKEWLDLYDDHVLQLIDCDPLTVYLRSPERWIESAPCDGNNEECVCVLRKKTAPGVDMHSDESYPLYGDPSKKRSFDRLTTPTTISACYTLQ